MYVGKDLRPRCVAAGGNGRCLICVGWLADVAFRLSAAGTGEAGCHVGGLRGAFIQRMMLAVFTFPRTHTGGGGGTAGLIRPLLVLLPTQMRVPDECLERRIVLVESQKRLEVAFLFVSLDGLEKVCDRNLVAAGAEDGRKTP